MRIRRVDVYGYVYTLAGGRYAYSSGRAITGVDSTLVKLSTDAGLAGWGEACTLGTTYMVGHPLGTRAALRQLAPALLGQNPLETSVLLSGMDAVLRGHGYAKSAIDVACWDLLGQATGQSVCTLLGGRFCDEYELYIAISMGTPSEMAERVDNYQKEGYRHFQLKVGSDPRTDADRVWAVLRQCRARDTVVVDANGGWSMEHAARVVREIEAQDVYLEQPCAS